MPCFVRLPVRPCPRLLLKTHTETPASLASKHYVQPEPLTPGMFGYSLLRPARNRDYFNGIMDGCLKFGVPIEGLHTETGAPAARGARRLRRCPLLPLPTAKGLVGLTVSGHLGARVAGHPIGPGVYEAALEYAEALEAADRAALFKMSTKEIAMPFGIMPSFMGAPVCLVLSSRHTRVCARVCVCAPPAQSFYGRRCARGSAGTHAQPNRTQASPAALVTRTTRSGTQRASTTSSTMRPTRWACRS